MRLPALHVSAAIALVLAMSGLSMAAESAPPVKMPSRVPLPVSPQGEIPLPLGPQQLVPAHTATRRVPGPGPAPSGVDVHGLISRYAALYDVPVDLVRRVVAHESRFNPAAHHRSYWGLMQIDAQTARRMGYHGPARGLLDPGTNLKYAVKYLRGAYLVARKDEARAVSYYRSGYYYRAKRMGLLEVAGLR